MVLAADAILTRCTEALPSPLGCLCSHSKIPPAKPQRCLPQQVLVQFFKRLWQDWWWGSGTELGWAQWSGAVDCRNGSRESVGDIKWCLWMGQLLQNHGFRCILVVYCIIHMHTHTYVLSRKSSFKAAAAGNTPSRADPSQLHPFWWEFAGQDSSWGQQDGAQSSSLGGRQDMSWSISHSEV